MKATDTKFCRTYISKFMVIMHSPQCEGSPLLIFRPSVAITCNEKKLKEENDGQILSDSSTSWWACMHAFMKTSCIQPCRKEPLVYMEIDILQIKIQSRREAHIISN